MSVVATFLSKPNLDYLTSIVGAQAVGQAKNWWRLSRVDPSATSVRELNQEFISMHRGRYADTSEQTLIYSAAPEPVVQSWEEDCLNVQLGPWKDQKIQRRSEQYGTIKVLYSREPQRTYRHGLDIHMANFDDSVTDTGADGSGHQITNTIRQHYNVPTYNYLSAHKQVITPKQLKGKWIIN